MRSLGTQPCVGDERSSAPWLLGQVPLILRILFVNWPQPAANAVTSVVDYWERVSGWVSCMSATRYCSWLGSRLIITLAKGIGTGPLGFCCTVTQVW
jgi:hypothetical protein